MTTSPTHSPSREAGSASVPIPTLDQFEGVPGDVGPPLVGHTLAFVRDATGLVDRMRRKHGPNFRLRMFGHPVFVIGDPDAVRFALLDRDDNFSSRLGWQQSIGELFSRGLMLRDFEEHRMHRSIMQGAFRAEALRAYTEMMSPMIERGIAGWHESGDFRFYPAIKKLTLDLAAEVFLGIPLGEEADRLNRAFTDSVQASIALIKKEVPGLSYRRGMNGRRTLERFFSERIAEKRAGSGRDMFSELCRATNESGERFTDRDVVDHMIFLLMAAHDTTTSSLTSLAYRLALDTDWQERLRQEALALGTRALAYEDKDRLPATDLAFKEALRLHPPVPFIGRRTLRETRVGGIDLPAGTPISICSLVTHFLDDHWTQPQRFDPDRFSAERREDKGHSHLYYPFGGGAHMCLGMHFAYLQVKAFLVQFLRRYRFRLVPGHRVTMIPIPIPRPREGLALELERIE